MTDTSRRSSELESAGRGQDVPADVQKLVDRIARGARCITRPGDRLDRLQEALLILHAVGLPITTKTSRMAERIGFALLALADVQPAVSWRSAKDITSHTLTTRGVIRWAREHYGDSRSDGSYDYVLREDLDDLLRAGFVQNTGRLGGLSYNDSTRAYGLLPEFGELLRTFGTTAWPSKLGAFMHGRPVYAELAEQARDVAMEVRALDYQGNPITIGLGPGPHNALIKKTVEQFLPRFGRGAQLLYLGDADDRDLFKDEPTLTELGIDLQDVLPDVLAISAETGWLFVIEAVHARGPVSHSKHERYQQLLAAWERGVVYVSAFETRAKFRGSMEQIAWETEVWLAEAPDHLIHFNGSKFLGPSRS